MTKTYNQELFLELYHQLMNNDLISEKIQRMISYREGRLYELQMAMEDKVEIMKESNVVSIIHVHVNVNNFVSSINLFKE